MAYRIVLFTHHCGGMGKTSTAIHYAGIIAASEHTLLVDYDSQADALDFFLSGTPEPLYCYESNQDKLRLMWNPSRVRINKLASFDTFDNVVADLDASVSGAASAIMALNPTHIFLPVNSSGMVKGTRHLDDMIELVASLNKKLSYGPKIIVTPLGVDRSELVNSVKRIKRPKSISVIVAKAMEDVQTPMQQSLKNGSYLWNTASFKQTKTYYKYLATL